MVRELQLELETSPSLRTLNAPPLLLGLGRKVVNEPSSSRARLVLNEPSSSCSFWLVYSLELDKAQLGSFTTLGRDSKLFIPKKKKKEWFYILGWN